MYEYDVKGCWLFSFSMNVFPTNLQTCQWWRDLNVLRCLRADYAQEATCKVGWRDLDAPYQYHDCLARSNKQNSQNLKNIRACIIKAWPWCFLWFESKNMGTKILRWVLGTYLVLLSWSYQLLVGKIQFRQVPPHSPHPLKNLSCILP